MKNHILKCFLRISPVLQNNVVRNASTELQRKGLPKKLPIAGVKKVILVSSAKGGVGKSLVSVNLAFALKHLYHDKEIGILDADVFGPSLPKMTGLKGEPELNKQNQMLPLVNYGVKCMSMGFLVNPDDAIIWRGLMVMSAMQKLLRNVNWGELDALIVDMPPGTGDTQLSIIQNIPIDGAVLVTTPQQVAFADVIRGTKMFKDLYVPILGMVQNMNAYKCTGCSAVHHLFGPDNGRKLAQQLDVNFLADIPIYSELSAASDCGVPLIVKDPGSEVSQIFLKLAKDIAEKAKL